LVAELRAVGRPVYPINPLAVARYRERTSVSGKKRRATTSTRRRWPTSSAPTRTCTGCCPTTLTSPGYVATRLYSMAPARLLAEVCRAAGVRSTAVHEGVEIVSRASDGRPLDIRINHTSVTVQVAIDGYELTTGTSTNGAALAVPAGAVRVLRAHVAG